MKKYVVISLLIVSSQFLVAQSIDEARMERDLEVAKNVLSTLYGQGGDMYFWGSRIDASYVPGYGVIFNIPEETFFYAPKPPGKRKGGVVIIGSGGEKEAQEIMTYNDHVDLEELEGPDVESIVRTFLADYADIIGQLKPEDRIMIKQKSRHEEFYIAWAGADDEVDIKPDGLNAEVSKKDISAYRQGKISRDEFDKRVSVTKSKPKEKVADLEMFSNMIKSFYSAGLSKTFFTEGRPHYEVLENYGAIFHMKTYSSYQEGDMYVMPVRGKEKVSENDRKIIIEELYPKFELELKEFIVDYGRTIRSLDADELLMVKVKLTRCKGCSIPSNIDVSLKMNVLKDYDQQKIKRDKALASIEIKKYEQ